MITKFESVSRTYSNLLVPMAQYVLTNILKESAPNIITSKDFNKSAELEDVQVDVYKTSPAVNQVVAIYDDKIITASKRYDEFCVDCFAKTRDEAKCWIDMFENAMVKKNQYRGKCLYAERESMFFKEVPKVLWDDVVLSEKVKKDIRLNTVEFLGNKKFSSSGVTKRGLVLYGPPGTGKTSVVKSVFNELEGKNVSRIYVTSESFRRMSVSSLFEFFAYLGPSVVAFEDIDMISGNRDGTIVSSNLFGDLLTNLDGMRKHNEPLVVIASTNRIDMLDSALASRPQRFDRKVELGLPTNDLLRNMYFKHLGSKVDDEIINLSKSFTGAHVVETVNTARILATDEDRQPFDCLKEACLIIRDNFFPGQDTIQLKAAIQTFLIKKGSKTNLIKTASNLSNAAKIANEILSVK